MTILPNIVPKSRFFFQIYRKKQQGVSYLIFSHNEVGGRDRETFFTKINTFQSMRKEVIGIAVFYIEKTCDYTVTSNHHLRNTLFFCVFRWTICGSIKGTSKPILFSGFFPFVVPPLLVSFIVAHPSCMGIYLKFLTAVYGLWF